MSRPLVYFTAASFPTTPLAFSTNDPTEQEERRQFAEIMARIANHYYPAVRVLVDRARARRTIVGEEQTRQELRKIVDALRTSIASTRALVAADPTVFLPTIQINGRNYDQWGDAPKRRDSEGNLTPASRMSIEIGKFIEGRFSQEAPGEDVLVNYYKVPDRRDSGGSSKDVEGNSLLRGSEADAAVEELARRLAEKGILNPKFGPAGKRTFTLSAPEESLYELYKAAQEASVDLVDGERDSSNPEDLSVYGNTSALKSVSFLFKRGSDASNRIEEAILFACAFGVAPIIDEQDDAQKYVRGQQGSIDWIRANQKIVPPGEETGNYVSPVEAREILGMPPESPYWRSFVALRADDGRELVHEPNDESLESFAELVKRVETKEFPASSAILRAESELLRVEGKPISSRTGSRIDLSYFARYGEQWEPIPKMSPFLKQPAHPLTPDIPAYRTQLKGRQTSGARLWPDKFKNFFARDVAPPPWDVYAAVGVIGEEPRATIRLTPDVLASKPRQGNWRNLKQKLGVKESETFYILARSSEDTDLVAQVVDHPLVGTQLAAQLRQRGSEEATPLAVLSAEDADQLLEKPYLVGAMATQFAPDYTSAEYQLRSQQPQHRQSRDAPEPAPVAAASAGTPQANPGTPHAIAKTGTAPNRVGGTQPTKRS